MSFLPGSLTPAFRSPWCAHIVASLRQRTYLIRTVIQLLDVEKQKEPITQSIRNRREHNSRFKVMSYVIGSENSKSGSAFFLLPPTEPKAWWSSSALPVCRYRVGWNRPMVEHWYSVVYVADNRCATIIQIHHLFVKFLNVSHYIRNFKERFSTGSEKDPSTG